MYNFVKNVAGKQCSIYEETSGATLSRILRIFEEAKRDFPFLDVTQVLIVKYIKGQSAGYVGIEFVVPIGTEIPASYERCNKLDQKY